MLAQEKIDEIDRLLASGKYSQRQISKMTGVSRGTIARFAQGDRVIVKVKKEPERGAYEGEWGRCPTCGAMTKLPCRACEFRAQGGVAKDLDFEPEHDILKIELTGEAKERYDAIHQEKLLRSEADCDLDQWEEEGYLPEFYYTAKIKRELGLLTA